MERLRLTVFLLLLASVPAKAVEIATGHEATIGIEAGYVHLSGYPSWTEQSYGKLRDDDEGLIFSRAYLDYHGRVTDTIGANVVLEAYDDDLGHAADFTEAFLEWRPVPRSATRYRLKLGLFYPRISLENTGAGWSSPYTVNSSAINTWVAEEIRSTGAELSISHRPASLGGAHSFTMNAAVFAGPDPAGSLISWRGWSLHSRQTRPSDDLPLPLTPQLQPDGAFGSRQDSYVEPLIEIDDEVGYYISAEWRMGQRILVRAMHFDNRADPSVLERGQYGWTTEFDHIGVQATLPWDIGLFAQWLDGSTVMGPFLGAWHPVENDYSAEYLMLTRAFDRHRVTARYDHFDVTDNDGMPTDDNNENGHAWTLNYQYGLNDYVTVALEWLNIKTHRGAWAYFGVDETSTEQQMQLFIRIRF